MRGKDIKKMLSNVKELDFMAPPVQLNVAGTAGVKTYFGLCMAMLYLLTISALGWFIVDNYFDTTNPRVA